MKTPRIVPSINGIPVTGALIESRTPSGLRQFTGAITATTTNSDRLAQLTGDPATVDTLVYEGEVSSQGRGPSTIKVPVQIFISAIDPTRIVVNSSRTPLDP